MARKKTPKKAPRKSTTKTSRKPVKPKAIIIDVDLPREVAGEVINEGIKKGTIEIHVSIT